jgi:hypothetical protein
MHFRELPKAAALPPLKPHSEFVPLNVDREQFFV